jgi:hypothetical protein
MIVALRLFKKSDAFLVNGFAERVLFGTDAPINLLFYKDMSTVEYIRWCISNLKDALTPEQFEIVMNNKFTNH